MPRWATWLVAGLELVRGRGATMPAWATYLVRVVFTRNGRTIIGAGEVYSLGGWWFNYPARAALRWKSGIRRHGVRRFLEFRRESWKFNREWRRR